VDAQLLAYTVAGLASAEGFEHAPEENCPRCRLFWRNVAAVLSALESEVARLHVCVEALEQAGTALGRVEEATRRPAPSRQVTSF
jgi:hypothetical protein